MTQAFSDDELMALALAEAKAALIHGDVPVGAVVVRGGELIASRHNERELTGDPTAHAEVLALRDAAAVVGGWRLDECTLVVTLEPCTMCAGAAINSRLKRLVYGAADMAAGACLSLYNVCDDPRINHRIELTEGVQAEQCATLLTDFFEAKR
jgi:tRNA(adenine34) deaminase